LFIYSSNELGPGVYDIHSPRVPSEAEMKQKADDLLKYLKPELLWINPDCGLKTRGWAETEAALVNLVAVAHQLREQYKA
jgi:5-methyltetrahydropteroyltriglutamate--homocysteine methyltransferase